MVNNMAQQILNNITLLKGNPTYKPIKYIWAEQAWSAQQQMHWIADEVPLQDDVVDFSSKLTPEEKYFVTHVFRFFVQGDVEVCNSYTHNFLKVFEPMEIQMMLTSFANAETIHISGYARLLDTLGLPEIEYSAFKNYADMKKKYELLHSFNFNNQITEITKTHIAKTMILFGAFIEGVCLFGSFAMLAAFQNEGKLKGVGQIITWSARDEQLHAQSMIKLYHTFVEENYNDIDHNEIKSFITEISDTIISLETSFIEAAFQGKKDITIAGLTFDKVCDYVKYTVQQRTEQLNQPLNFGITENPIPWMDSFLYLPEHVNFFESRATEYTKGGLIGDMGFDNDDDFVKKN